MESLSAQSVTCNSSSSGYSNNFVDFESLGETDDRLSPECGEDKQDKVLDEYEEDDEVEVEENDESKENIGEKSDKSIQPEEASLFQADKSVEDVALVKTDENPSDLVSVDGVSPVFTLNTSEVSGSEAAFNPKSALKKSNVATPKKSVKFPDGHLVVQSFLDPINPWKTDPITEKGDVIRLYIEASIQFKTHCLTSVVHSITIRPGETHHHQGELYIDFAESGIREVTMKEIDALEPVLSRYQWDKIIVGRSINGQTENFEGSVAPPTDPVLFADEEVAGALFDMIEYYESCLSLCIPNFKNVANRAMHSLSKLIRNIKSPIHTLDIHGNQPWLNISGFDDRNSKLFTFSVRNASRNLKVLHVENCGLSGRGLVLLCAAMRLNSFVEAVFLGDNRLTGSDMIHIAQVIKSPDSSGLKVLDLRNNNLGDSGVCALMEALIDCQRALNSLTENSSKTKSASYQHKGLKALGLWNTNMSQASVGPIANMLANTSVLETLNLGANPNIGTNDNIFTIKDSLVVNRSLLRLSMQNCSIRNEGAIALAEVLANQARFLRLDLRSNPTIDVAGYMALIKAAEEHPSVIRIDLDDVADCIGLPDDPIPKIDLDAAMLESVRNTFLKVREKCESNLDKLSETQMRCGGKTWDASASPLSRSGDSADAVEQAFDPIDKEKIESSLLAKKLFSYARVPTRKHSIVGEFGISFAAKLAAGFSNFGHADSGEKKVLKDSVDVKNVSPATTKPHVRTSGRFSVSSIASSITNLISPGAAKAAPEGGPASSKVVEKKTVQDRKGETKVMEAEDEADNVFIDAEEQNDGKKEEKNEVDAVNVE